MCWVSQREPRYGRIEILSRTLVPIFVLATGLVASPYYYPAFLLLLVHLVYRRRGRLRYSAVAALAPLTVLLAAGLAFIFANPPLDALRDLWYITKILLIALAGLTIGVTYSFDPAWLRRLTPFAVILAAIEVAYASLGTASEGGRHISYLVAVIAPFCWRYLPGRNTLDISMRVTIVALALTMIVLSESRAGLMTFILSYMASRGVFQKKNKAFLLVGMVVVLTIVIWPLLPQYDAANITFLGKITRSFSEIAFETGADRVEMYLNWRGFEAYRAFQTWLEAPVYNWIVGLGFGTSIELGQVVLFGDAEIEKLPFAHNAYFTLLVKTGIVGIVSMVYFLLLPFRTPAQYSDANLTILSQVARGSAIVLLVTAALISGPLNKQSLDGVLLLWAWSSGVLIGQRQWLKSTRVVKKIGGSGRMPSDSSESLSTRITGAG